MNRLVYPQKWKWYNSVKRASVGACLGGASAYNDCTMKSSGTTEVLTVLLDGTGTSSTNLKETTLFTFANGVKIKISWYASEQTGTQGGYYISGYTHMVDINDNDIVPSQGLRVFTSYQDSTIDRIKLYYVSSFLNYSLNDHTTLPETGNYGGGFAMGGALFGKNYWSNPNQPYIGTDMDVYRLSLNWNYNTFFLKFNWTDIESTYNTIVNGGDGTPILPIAPDEDTSTIGGGDGEYDPFSDPIDFPGLPIGGGALASGFIRMYNPSSVQLNLLSSELWSDNFIDEIKRIQNDPLEAIVSLHSIPFNLVVASTARCQIGNYESNVTMGVVDAQYYTINCGNISVPEHWGSALDYAPYTQVEVYLPFVGVKPLQIDDIMGKVLNVKYNIDILTGAALCMLKCGDSVLYTYNTEVAQNIPFSASSHAQLYQSIISASGAVVGMMSGGAGAIVSGIQSAASVAASKHSQVSRGGSLGGTVGVLGDFVPYLIIHRPIQSLAADFAHKKGYPSNITATLSSLSGYTEVDTIHLEGVPCTDSERNELYNILKEGVIL